MNIHQPLIKGPAVNTIFIVHTHTLIIFDSAWRGVNAIQTLWQPLPQARYGKRRWIAPGFKPKLSTTDASIGPPNHALSTDRTQ